MTKHLCACRFGRTNITWDRRRQCSQKCPSRTIHFESQTEGRYVIELWNNPDRLDCAIAWSASREKALLLYDLAREQHPDRLVMLCQKARVIPRSDRL